MIWAEIKKKSYSWCYKKDLENIYKMSMSQKNLEFGIFNGLYYPMQGVKDA